MVVGLTYWFVNSFGGKRHVFLYVLRFPGDKHSAQCIVIVQKAPAGLWRVTVSKLEDLGAVQSTVVTSPPCFVLRLRNVFPRRTGTRIQPGRLTRRESVVFTF